MARRSRRKMSRKTRRRSNKRSRRSRSRSKRRSRRRSRRQRGGNVPEMELPQVEMMGHAGNDSGAADVPPDDDTGSLPANSGDDDSSESQGGGRRRKKKGGKKRKMNAFMIAKEKARKGGAESFSYKGKTYKKKKLKTGMVVYSAK